MGLSSESIYTIRNSLFAPIEEREEIKKKLKLEDTVFIDVDKDEIVTYYVVEMLTDIIKGTHFTMSKRTQAIHLLFLVGLNAYDVPPVNGFFVTNCAHFNHDKNMRVNIIKLIDVIQFSIEDPIMRKTLINYKFKLQDYLNQNVAITKGKHEIYYPNESHDFYQRALQNWNPITYALEKMKNLSDMALKRIKPDTFIDIFCIDYDSYKLLQNEILQKISGLDNSTNKEDRDKTLKQVVQKLSSTGTAAT
jgi:hypothetical protein